MCSRLHQGLTRQTIPDTFSLLFPSAKLLLCTETGLNQHTLNRSIEPSRNPQFFPLGPGAVRTLEIALLSAVSPIPPS